MTEKQSELILYWMLIGKGNLLKKINRLYKIITFPPYRYRRTDKVNYEVASRIKGIYEIKILI